MFLNGKYAQLLVMASPIALAAIQPSTFTAPGAFPTSAFSTYYNHPTATSVQPQPVISDPVLHTIFPLSLTDPETIPTNNTVDPHPLPPVASSSQILDAALAQLKSIATNPFITSNPCAACQTSLELAKFVSLAAPSEAPQFFVEQCIILKLADATSCNIMFGLFSGLGAMSTQLAASADVGGYDGQAICQSFFGLCPSPPTVALNLTNWFAKPKPNPLPLPKRQSGQRLKVLHLSDFHIDPRFATGSEANCTTGLCCRANNHNDLSPDQVLLPAPRYGSFLCDTSMSLALAALEAIPILSGTKDSGFAYTIYTGDLVSHDKDNQLGRAYIEYTEAIVFDLFKRNLGSGPVYAALGNHDTYNSAQDAPLSLGGDLGEQFSWNYDHVADLWQEKGWIPGDAANLARAHYAGYMVRRADGLRIITLNTDMWFTANLLNFINMTNSDPSGMLRFLTDELQDAEDAGDRVWILGHVPSGFRIADPLRNPTNLFYQIVDRFSPHVIANIFFGHTHMDQLSIFYANNATKMSAHTALAVSWIGPSVTPVTNFNSGFRVYEIDSATFEVMDAHTWIANVSTFPSLDHQTKFGPTYAYEYNTRQTYGAGIKGWGPDDPLNATWWHLVTEAMEANHSLVETFNTFETKSSILTPPCTDDCIASTICSIRSGSAALLFANCPGT